ncbi:MAG: hypothetical protein QM831_12715 [Kofleriaceae bacterium]
MKRCAISLIVALGCGKTETKPTAAAGSDHAAPAVASAPVAPAAPAAAPIADIDPCSLVSAADVGTAFDKKGVIAAKDGSHQCSFGLDPAEQQKAMEDFTKGGFAKVAQGGGIKMPSAITSQLNVTLEIAPANQSEDEIKSTYNMVGSAVAGLDPKSHGLSDAIVNGQEIHDLGDWAFTTNVAAVNMGNGISTRGRILQAKRGNWQLTLSVTIAPDPGAAKLDEQMVAIAKPALSKFR